MNDTVENFEIFAIRVKIANLTSRLFKNRKKFEKKKTNLFVYDI